MTDETAIDPCYLEPELIGYEGKYVEVWLSFGMYSRFWVSRTAGPRPFHVCHNTKGKEIQRPYKGTIALVTVIAPNTPHPKHPPEAMRQWWKKEREDLERQRQTALT